MCLTAAGIGVVIMMVPMRLTKVHIVVIFILVVRLTCVSEWDVVVCVRRGRRPTGEFALSGGVRWRDGGSSGPYRCLFDPHVKERG
jgi:hypothetical protein